MPANDDNSQPAYAWPKPAYAWYLVALLTIAYICSFADRYVLGLLIEPIKAEMNLSDTQISLLLGPAFAIFYATMGLPLGWLADRKRRTWIVAAGIAVWSTATVACGLAKNFLHLFLARMSVGIGEATLSPCAISMISDSFPKERRGKPIGFYSMALSIGAGIALLFSGAVLKWAESVPAIALPVFGVVAPWQFVFIAVGLPGLGLALLFFLLREPTRQQTAATVDVGAANLSDTARYLLRRRKTFAGFLAPFCLMTTIAYSQGWLPAMFARTWGWEASTYAFLNGAALLLLGPATVTLSGWHSDRLFRRGVSDAPLRIALVGAAIMVLTGVAAPLMPTAYMAFFVYALNAIGISMATATGVTALLNITPDKIRAQTVAFYYMTISLTGLLLGPTTVGLLTDQLFGEQNLAYSMALLPLLYGVPVLLFIPLIRRHYDAAYFEMHGRAAFEAQRQTAR